MSNPWIPPTGGSWDNLDLYLRSEQAIKLSIVQGDGNSTNIETAMNWLGDRVMSYSYIAGLSIAGRATDSAGNVSVITAGSDHQILRRNGTSLAFGSIDLSQSGAVGSSILGTGNGGTGLSAIGTALQYIRVNAGGTALEYATLSVTGFVPYTGATQDLSMGIYSIAATGLNLSGLTASRLVATNGSKKLESLSGTGLVRLTSGAITYDSSAYITLTSLSSTATGLSYSNTTGVFSLTAGYVIPTTNDVSFWNSAYNNRITSLSVTGSSGSATLLSNVLNIPTYTLTGLGATASTLAATQTFTLAPTFSAMTAGSVLFAGASGVLSQDNVKFKYTPTGYNSNASLLLNATAGAVTPLATFHIRGSAATAATKTLYIENSSSVLLNSILDDGTTYFKGTVGIGVTSPSTLLHLVATTTQFMVGYNSTTYTNMTVDSSGNFTIAPIVSAGTMQVGIADLRVGNSYVNSPRIFSFSSSSQTPDVAGKSLAFYSYVNNAAYPTGAFTFDTNGNYPSSPSILINILSTYGGTATYSFLNFGQTVNTITGGAVIVGLNHAPILTSAYNYIAFNFTSSAAYAPNAAITDYIWSKNLPNINASVNSQVITAHDIVLSGSNGAFTGVLRNALRVSGGDINIASVGNGLKIKEGTNATMGTGTLVAGGCTINTTKVTANSRIFISAKPNATYNGVVKESPTIRVVGTSFYVVSFIAGTNTVASTDVSQFDWIIIEPS